MQTQVVRVPSAEAEAGTVAMVAATTVCDTSGKSPVWRTASRVHSRSCRSCAHDANCTAAEAVDKERRERRRDA
eukprot:3216946-Pleurochrysis_carterae.AAC.2